MSNGNRGGIRSPKGTKRRPVTEAWPEKFTSQEPGFTAEGMPCMPSGAIYEPLTWPTEQREPSREHDEQLYPGFA